MLADALGYPLKHEDSVGTIIIGSVLLLASAAVWFLSGILLAVLIGIFMLPLALVPLAIVQGYQVRVLKRTIDGDNAPPSFTQWGELLADGIKAWLIKFIYAIPLFAILAILFFSGFLSSISQSELAQASFGIFSIIGLLFFVGYSLLSLYLIPLGLCSFADDGTISAAFRFSQLSEVGLNGNFAVGWLLAVFVVVIGQIFGVPLSLLIIGVTILFYTRVVEYRLFASGYRQAIAGSQSNSEPRDMESMFSETGTE
ncbi:DUF4013 domain-containing protein [Haloferax volcanii]|uniref:DUF4013 family protein n=1 Tax=Haloferax volcanii (strain ATCC 29605 / DSM 3757 / JCM 8879 / NBRC 14742 / NCIMB 2012 / VKM B-1768 / DS2) TaxID=309800 RepID=D4GXK2_HALVD|nr:DUF4013 domain-containing protein [Haloferax volcanii]ADE04511.2 DUF4013 family protein [Haloferax volcanii DS2]MDW7538463.1 DUF4013 domain-containing protein [Haloferax volcanii]